MIKMCFLTLRKAENCSFGRSEDALKGDELISAMVYSQFTLLNYQFECDATEWNFYENGNIFWTFFSWWFDMVTGTGLFNRNEEILLLSSIFHRKYFSSRQCFEYKSHTIEHSIAQHSTPLHHKCWQSFSIFIFGHFSNWNLKTDFVLFQSETHVA